MDWANNEYGLATVAKAKEMLGNDAAAEDLIRNAENIILHEGAAGRLCTVVMDGNTAVGYSGRC